MQQCSQCGKEDAEAYRLMKCPMCFKVVCEECSVRLYGRYFCSNTCATNFFFTYDEDEK